MPRRQHGYQGLTTWRSASSNAGPTPVSALIHAATSGNPKFFLGTDSAPHARDTKEAACGCAGVYNAHAAIELYAVAFEEAGALDKLEAFASFNGPDFYDLPEDWQTTLNARLAQSIARMQSRAVQQFILGDRRVLLGDIQLLTTVKDQLATA